MCCITLVYSPGLSFIKLSEQRFWQLEPCQSPPMSELAETAFQVVVRNPSDIAEPHNFWPPPPTPLCVAYTAVAAIGWPWLQSSGGNPVPVICFLFFGNPFSEALWELHSSTLHEFVWKLCFKHLWHVYCHQKQDASCYYMWFISFLDFAPLQANECSTSGQFV